MSSDPRPAAESAIVANMVAVATELVASFSEVQRSKATWSFPSDDERRRWFYTPTDHGGLALAEMSSGQQRLVQRLLASILSEGAYVTAANIMALENILDRLEGFSVQFGRERGRDPLLYWVAVFGSPATDGTWSWRFGGHHISLSVTVQAGKIISTTPCFFGADPASSPLLGPHLHRPLAAAGDLGRDLVRSLDTEQAMRAIVSTVPPTDIVGGNRTLLSEGDRPLPLPAIWRGRLEEELNHLMAKAQERAEANLGLTSEHLDAVAFTSSPKGLNIGGLSAEQKELFQALLRAYIGRIHPDLADAQMDKFNTSAIDGLSFVWAGGVEPGEPHYYRIQGGDLLVEYDNGQRGANHIHTVWRDLTLDFGGDPLASHYADSH